jgi:hypothetical protein
VVFVLGSAPVGGQPSSPSLSDLEGSEGSGSWPDDEATSVFPGIDDSDSEDGDWFDPFVDQARRVSGWGRGWMVMMVMMMVMVMM